MALLNRCFGVPELNSRDAMGCLGGSEQAVLTRRCDAPIIGDNPEEGRRSAHYDLKWEIPVQSEMKIWEGSDESGDDIRQEKSSD